MDEQCMTVGPPSGVEMNDDLTSQNSPKIVSDLDSKGFPSNDAKCILQKGREDADEAKSKDGDDTTSTCGIATTNSDCASTAGEENVRQAIRMTRALSFPQKMMCILSEEKYHSIVSWEPSGESFAIRDRKAFVMEVLPKEFKQAKFDSFTRKLRRWGFQKILSGNERGAFAHQHFKRNRLDLCLKMHCKKSTGRYHDDEYKSSWRALKTEGHTNHCPKIASTIQDTPVLAPNQYSRPISNNEHSFAMHDKKVFPNHGARYPEYNPNDSHLSMVAQDPSNPVTVGADAIALSGAPDLKNASNLLAPQDMGHEALLLRGRSEYSYPSRLSNGTNVYSSSHDCVDAMLEMHNQPPSTRIPAAIPGALGASLIEMKNHGETELMSDGITNSTGVLSSSMSSDPNFTSSNMMSTCIDSDNLSHANMITDLAFNRSHSLTTQNDIQRRQHERVQDLSRPQDRFERGIDYATVGFGSISHGKTHFASTIGHNDLVRPTSIYNMPNIQKTGDIKDLTSYVSNPTESPYHTLGGRTDSVSMLEHFINVEKERLRWISSVQQIP